jgi:hypothetical protein
VGTNLLIIDADHIHQGNFIISGSAGICPIHSDTVFIQVVDPMHVALIPSAMTICEFDT